MNITIGFSPCPNDTFIFDALINKKIDTQGIQFEPLLADVEELNKLAFKAQLDVSKLSYYTYLQLTHKYILSNSGSALGKGMGPLLICKSDPKVLENKLKNGEKVRIAIAGKNTTSNFLLQYAYPTAVDKLEMYFYEIEQAILDNKVDVGVIIHENRFTYANKGLKLIADLGAYWETHTQSPIPLGGIAINRKLNYELQTTISMLIRKSIDFAFNNPQSSYDYVKAHAQEMDDMVIKQHIELYVNEYSMDLGTEGKQAIFTMAKKAEELKEIPKITQPLFVF